MDERTLVYFANNPDHLLDAYAESGEGIDRAGGFAAQVSSRSPRLMTIFDKSNRDWVEYWYAKLKGTSTMLLGSQLQHFSNA